MKYVGAELELFAKAVRWKRYWSSFVRPYLHGHVLDVGAGTGVNIRYLDRDGVSWHCLEPNAELAAKIDRRHNIRIGTISDLPSDLSFAAVLYIDVLEHIQEDQEELRRVASHLVPGGHLIVLVPAYEWLYSPFDKAVGHYRRYTRVRLRSLFTSCCRLVESRYLDSAGALLSLGNRLLLRRGTPTEKQIAFWDRYIVPLSVVTDRFFCYSVGRSVLTVWRIEE